MSRPRVRCAAWTLSVSAALAPVAVSAQSPAPSATVTVRSAQPALVVRDVGPGAAGRLLRGVLAQPHLTMTFVDSGPALALRSDSSFSTSVVIYGRDVTAAGAVHGDVVVIGGDLFLHPGATIDGRAVAIGGGVYNSTLATVRGAQLSFRDETFVPEASPGALAAGAASDTLALVYRRLGGAPPPIVSFPVYGLRLPSYDRVNGLSLPFGPYVSLDSGRVEIEPLVTYRSDLGAVDPLVRGRIGLGRRTELTAYAGRVTPTNDDWNRSDFLNSISSIFSGIDARNYYRADRGEVRATRVWEGETFGISPFIGALTERAWSVGPEPGTQSAPWSLFLRRRIENGMVRPNPPILPGRISSAVVGANLAWTAQQVVAGLGALVEQPFDAPSDLHFTQATLDGEVGFPTVGTQRLDLNAHAVITAGDTAPPQRYAYLGGEDGTIVTLRLLELGGDQFLYVNGLYSIPIERIRVPYLGSPTFALRYAVGGAGVGRLPELVQNVGFRVSIRFVRFQFMLDPVTHDTRSSIAFTFYR